MSKVYNIIEAINMPVGTEFEVYLDGKENPDSKLADGNMIVNYDYEFVWAKNNERIDEIDRKMFNAKFYKLPKIIQVDPLTAIGSNKLITLTTETFEYKNMNLHDLMEQLSLRNNKEIKEAFESGEWYIEE